MSRVDLPEPDGPHEREEFAAGFRGDVVQCGDLDFTLRVNLRQFAIMTMFSFDAIE